MLREPTIEKLSRLALASHGSVWMDQDRSPDTIALSFDERLALLVDAEMLARENARLTKNLKDAKLRIADACIEGIDFPRSAKSTRPSCARSHVSMDQRAPDGDRHRSNRHGKELHRLCACSPSLPQRVPRNVPSRAPPLRRTAPRPCRRDLSSSACADREDRRSGARRLRDRPAHRREPS